MSQREVLEAFDKAVSSYRTFMADEEPAREKKSQPVPAAPTAEQQQQQQEPLLVVGTVVGMWDAATGKALGGGHWEKGCT